MKRNIFKFSGIMFITIVLSLGLVKMVIYANSGPSSWERDPAGEIRVIDEETPIEVISENLDFKVGYSVN
jgi:hypothetical protein